MHTNNALKTISLFVLFVFSGHLSFAQSDTSDFEFPNVPTLGFWDGADFSAGYQSGHCYFPNSYDTSFGFGYWASGFAWSTLTDSITPGYANLMSARTGSGFNSSGYGMGQQAAVVKFIQAPKKPQSMYVTNSTYAYFSMLNGDSFAKKFGGITGNDPDYFKLTAFSYSGGTATGDSAEIYLADYRFTNNSQDYLIKDWTTFDLSTLPACDSIKFILRSSDVGTFGINTPTFFCIDNLIASIPLSVHTNHSVPQVLIYPNPSYSNALQINFSEGKTARIKLYSTNGQLIFDENYTSGPISGTESLPSGIYLLDVEIGQNTQKTKWVKN